MDITSELIDSIVQKVIARLQQAGALESASKDCPTNVLTIDDRLVTLATIEKKIEGIKQLEVKPKAVVTPAVFDLLRDKSIQLRRTANGASNGSKKKVVVATTEPQANPHELNRWLRDHLFDAIPITNSSTEDLVAEIARRQLTDAEKVIVISSCPFQFACVANRNEQLRAIAALDAKTAAQAVNETDANVLVMDSKQTCSKTAEAFLR